MSRRRIWTLVGVLSASLVVFAGWSMAPTVALALTQIERSDNHGLFEEDSRIADLIAYGPRVVEPILSAIRKDGVSSKNSAFLPHVLAKIGSPAHKALLTAIKSEPNPRTRIDFIYCIQAGFSDYRHLPDWLNLLPQYPRTQQMLTEQLMVAGLHVPAEPVLAPSPKFTYNPAFVRWYCGMLAPRGPFPEWAP